MTSLLGEKKDKKSATVRALLIRKENQSSWKKYDEKASLYKDAFSSYFFQDDWFSFRISNARTVADFLSFFSPRSDVIYYRPLGMQLPFFLMQRFFGLSPLPYRLLSLFTIIAASVVVYKFIDDILQHKI